MLGVVGISLSGAHLYYKSQNSRVDPRIRPARELYEKYNSLAAAGDYNAVFRLLDSVESIYQKHPHYRNSFETGVLSNNRAAAYLTIALYRDSLPQKEKIFPQVSEDSLVEMAEKEVEYALAFYNDWKKKYAGFDREKWREMIGHEFRKGLKDYSQEEKEKFLSNRLDEFEITQTEIDRRLSVSHTNLGMIHRYRENYDSALLHYTRAMELWEDNISAENNLNVLLNKPKKKRGLLRKLFPPPRNKE
jgi:tetratricopeptide (TPR) repeat protein